jgi:GntR family transcriptional regulator
MPTSDSEPARDPSDPTPLYFWLKNVLRNGIESLEFSPGGRLPSERALAETYGVSRITVRQALDLLAREGLIRRRRGRLGGTFVREGAATARAVKLSGSFDALFSKRDISRIEVLALDVRSSNADVASALRLPAGSPVTYVERILVTAGGPIAYVRNFLPVAVGRRLARRELASMMVQEALRRHGVRLTRVRDEVEATLADATTARLLDIRPGRPLLSLRRVFFAQRETPVNLTLLLIASDRYTMTLTLRADRTG